MLIELLLELFYKNSKVESTRWLPNVDVVFQTKI